MLLSVLVINKIHRSINIPNFICQLLPPKRCNDFPEDNGIVAIT